MNNTTYHVPVMLSEALEGLNILPSGIYIDATFGGGGHSAAMLNALSPDGLLYAFDQDPDALANVFMDKRFTLIEANFRHIKRFLKQYGITQVNGILADLGVSSHQFNEPERGFSFRFDTPADMRMDAYGTLTAADYLNTATEQDIAQTLSLYGELAKSRAIAHALVVERLRNPIFTTGQINEIVLPYKGAEKESKFLAKIYQALRIVVNDEMGALKDLLQQSAALLEPGGRLVVISYHSLEDRLVKNFLRTGNFNDQPEKDFYGNLKRPFKPVSNKAIVPSAQEILENKRARSAKLRIGEKLI